MGIMLGFLVQNAKDDNANVISAILMSLSTGVFLHVTFLSLIPSEFSSNIKNHCGSNVEEEYMMTRDPFYKEDTEFDKDADNTTCPVPSLSNIDENDFSFTLLKALFFVCGWVTLSLLTLLTAGHHH